MVVIGDGFGNHRQPSCPLDSVVSTCMYTCQSAICIYILISKLLSNISFPFVLSLFLQSVCVCVCECFAYGFIKFLYS